MEVEISPACAKVPTDDVALAILGKTSTFDDPLVQLTNFCFCDARLMTVPKIDRLKFQLDFLKKNKKHNSP